MAFEAGEGNVLVAEPKTARELIDKGYVAANAGYTSGIVELFGDTKNPDSIFANKKVREAIDYALDRESVVKLLGYGFWVPCYQIAPPDKTVAYNPAIKGRMYNPEKAKQLLAEAGYPNGFETSIIITPTLHTLDAFTFLQGNLEKVGIKAKLDNMDYSRWSSYRDNGWKNALMGYFNGADTNYVASVARIFSPRSRTYPVVARPAGWDELIQRAEISFDPKERQEIMYKIAQMHYDEIMGNPVYGTGRPNIMSPKVHDTGINEVHHVLWFPENAWLSK